uniref:Uncharacterized protein n=1 Tax=Opuntia streptacantha TaxID=393608 RepID=A0A7C9F032_OPUST
MAFIQVKLIFLRHWKAVNAIVKIPTSPATKQERIKKCESATSDRLLLTSISGGSSILRYSLCTKRKADEDYLVMNMVVWGMRFVNQRVKVTIILKNCYCHLLS